VQSADPPGPPCVRVGSLTLAVEDPFMSN